MTRHVLLPPLRGALLLAACATGACGAWLLARGPLLVVLRPALDSGPGSLPGLGLPALVAGACAAALLGCAVWLAATTALAVLAEMPVHAGATCSTLDALAERRCPAMTRTVVAALLGLAVGTAAAGAAHADPSAGPKVHRGPAVLTGLALPDRVTGPVRDRVPAALPGRTPTVVVRRGDSLWSIAAGLLARGADDATVTAAWHRLHLANVSRIGDDPDLILPGTRLVVPGPLAPHGEERQ